MISAHDPVDEHAPMNGLTNKIIKILSVHGNLYKTFGENIILLINREGNSPQSQFRSRSNTHDSGNIAPASDTQTLIPHFHYTKHLRVLFYQRPARPSRYSDPKSSRLA